MGGAMKEGRERGSNRGALGPAPFVMWMDMPDRRLGLNYKGRIHRGLAISLTKKAREESAITADFVMLGGIQYPHQLVLPQWHAVTIRYTFVFGNHRTMEDDNLRGLTKPVRDGLVDAGLLSTDRRVTELPIEIEVDPGYLPVLCVEVWPDE